MPVIPFNSQAPAPRRPPPDEPFALMALAQMHAEGRLIAYEPKAPADGR